MKNLWSGILLWGLVSASAHGGFESKCGVLRITAGIKSLSLSIGNFLKVIQALNPENASRIFTKKSGAGDWAVLVIRAADNQTLTAFKTVSQQMDALDENLAADTFMTQVPVNRPERLSSAFGAAKCAGFVCAGVLMSTVGSALLSSGVPTSTQALLAQTTAQVAVAIGSVFTTAYGARKLGKPGEVVQLIDAQKAAAARQVVDQIVEVIGNTIKRRPEGLAVVVVSDDQNSVGRVETALKGLGFSLTEFIGRQPPDF